MPVPPLPTELLSHILDLATSPYDAVSAYKEDQQLLRWCCLVSKSFRNLVQPMLWSVFIAKRGDVSVLTAVPDLAQHIRVVELQLVWNKVDAAFSVLKTLGNLFDVRVSGGWNLTKNQLEGLKGSCPLFSHMRASY
jgi:hypothetical protein